MTDSSRGPASPDRGGDGQRPLGDGKGRVMRRGIAGHAPPSRAQVTQRQPAPNVIGLPAGLRHLGPRVRARALPPQEIQPLEGRLAVLLFFRQKTTNDEPGTSDAGAAVHVDAASPG
jgi:hypothetical protein